MGCWHRMLYGYGAVALVWCCLPPAVAQTSKEILLSELKIAAPPLERFSAGIKIRRVDSSQIETFRFGSLADLLRASSTLAFKNYGNGRLTTISFRGTSASHTTVRWNGININQPTLGQTDFSTIPVSSFDQLTVMFGGASSAFGTDAVGGSIHLSSQPKWQVGNQWMVGQQVASFGNINTQASARICTGNWEHKSSILYQSQPNRYPYDSRHGYVVGLAKVSRFGLTHDSFYRNAKGQLWALNAWVQDGKTTIEPKGENTHQHDWSGRFLASLLANSIETKIGFIQDNLQFQTATSRVNRVLLRTEKSWKLTLTTLTIFHVKGGMEANHYQAIVDGYGRQSIKENRVDGYLLITHQYGQKLTTSLNLRQAYVVGRAVPFAPSLGLAWKVVQLQKSQFTWKANLSKSYHAPTLNERYWIPQGNPQILPEIGVHTESGIVYNWQPFESLTSEINVHGYRNQVKNWIIWNPDRNFRAENIQKVLVTGLELELNMLYKSTERSFGFYGSYSYVKSSYQSVNSPFDQDIIGKQLIYVPLHKGVVGIRTHIRQTSFGLQGQFTGTRFTTSDNTKYLAAFAVFNTQFTQKVQLLKHPACLSLHVNNVFNSLQLSLENKAMPGRNLALNLLFYFTKHKQS